MFLQDDAKVEPCAGAQAGLAFLCMEQQLNHLRHLQQSAKCQNLPEVCRWAWIAWWCVDLMIFKLMFVQLSLQKAWSQWRTDKRKSFQWSCLGYLGLFWQFPWLNLTLVSLGRPLRWKRRARSSGGLATFALQSIATPVSWSLLHGLCFTHLRSFLQQWRT